MAMQCVNGGECIGCMSCREEELSCKCCGRALEIGDGAYSKDCKDYYCMDCAGEFIETVMEDILDRYAVEI